MHRATMTLSMCAVCTGRPKCFCFFCISVNMAGIFRVDIRQI